MCATCCPECTDVDDIARQPCVYLLLRTTPFVHHTDMHNLVPCTVVMGVIYYIHAVFCIVSKQRNVSCRVLPSLSERYCFTIWLSQTRRGGMPPVQPLSKLLQSGAPPVHHCTQPCPCKLAYWWSTEICDQLQMTASNS